MNKIRVLLFGLLAGLLSTFAQASEPLHIGNRLELFVDNLMIQQVSGTATQVLHKPEPQEIVFVADKPWEGNTSFINSIFEDGDRYRMYYRASHYIVPNTNNPWGSSKIYGMAYAESKDGLHWERPVLGRVVFAGFKRNNLMTLPVSGWDSQAFVPTKNDNPLAGHNEKYIATIVKDKGLHVLTSANGLDWKLPEQSLITTNGIFDSVNTIFWDTHHKLYRYNYRHYARTPRTGMIADGIRQRHYLCEEQEVDMLYFALFRKRWAELAETALWRTSLGLL